MSYLFWLSENIEECRYLYTSIVRVLENQPIMLHSSLHESEKFARFTEFLYRISRRT